MAAPSFVDGTVVHDTDLQFLIDPPRVQVYWAAAGGPQNITNSTFTIVQFDTQVYDTDSMWTPGSPSRITFNTAGLYVVHAYVQGPAATYTANSLNVRRNSGGSPSGGSTIRTNQFPTFSGNRFVLEERFAAGDHLELAWFQTTGGTAAVVAGTHATGVTARFVAI